MIVRKIKVNEYEYQPPINYVAGATEPDIQFQITDYVIPSGAEARAFVQRFDGTFEYTVATIDDQDITIEPTSSMFSVKGEGAIQVTLYVGDEVVKNFSVPVFVHADLADDAAQEGRDIVSIFHESEQAALEQFQEDAEEVAAEVIESIPSEYTALSNEVDELNERFTALEFNAVSEELKQALLQIAEKVAYVDQYGQEYYDALLSALYPDKTLTYITAVYTQSGTVYDTENINNLKNDLVVTAHYDDTSTETITSYTLSGTLVAGTSTITVLYNGKNTTFDVTVTAYWDYKWDASSGVAPVDKDGVSASGEFVDGLFKLATLTSTEYVIANSAPLEFEFEFVCVTKNNTDQFPMFSLCHTFSSGKGSGFKVYNSTSGKLTTSISGSAVSSSANFPSGNTLQVMKGVVASGGCSLDFAGQTFTGSGVTNNQYLLGTSVGYPRTASSDFRLSAIRYKYL